MLTPGWSFGETKNDNVNDSNKNTENKSDTNINTGPALLLTYECGHAIPVPTQQGPHPSKTECRQCAWRKAFHDARKVRKAHRRQAEELRKAIDINHSLWEELHVEVEHDQMFDGTATAAQEKLAEFLDFHSIEWHRKMFSYDMLMSNAVRDVLDPWVRKWGQPTDSELNRWVHWKLQAADEAEAEQGLSVF